MHLGTSSLLRFFDAHREDASLVLATIIGTRGSTYRKTGAMMLIAPDHSYQGLISGGCLEGDLLLHADEVFTTGKPKRLTYDLHAGDDLVWGLGIGCDGVIDLLLQRLDPPGDFAMLDWIGAALQSGHSLLLALASHSDQPGLPPGALGLLDAADRRLGHESLVELCAAQRPKGWPHWRHLEVEHAGASVMLVNIRPQPQVLLCGAGPDAVPVARQFAALDWRCVVADHRPAHARADRFPPGCQVILSRPQQLHEQLDLTGFDAAVIMSHHLDHDAAYLGQLAPAVRCGSLHYLGVLGPAVRRKRLQAMARCPVLPLHGPVGLDIGAELPEGIALSIAAEIHAVLNDRDGLALTGKAAGRALRLTGEA